MAGAKQNTTLCSTCVILKFCLRARCVYVCTLPLPSPSCILLLSPALHPTNTHKIDYSSLLSPNGSFFFHIYIYKYGIIINTYAHVSHRTQWFDIFGLIFMVCEVPFSYVHQSVAIKINNITYHCIFRNQMVKLIHINKYPISKYVYTSLSPMPEKVGGGNSQSQCSS